MGRDNSQQMSDYNYITKYAQRKADGSKESWEESIDRIYDMHAVKYSEYLVNLKLDHLLKEARQAEKDKVFLSAQRFRQFASVNQETGIWKHNFKAYNCSSTYMDRPEVFGELMYVLLNGAGAGISVQKHHIDNLPAVSPVGPMNLDIPGQLKTLYINDSIEGWADAIQALMDSYFDDQNIYQSFNYTKIRPQGSEIAGQFLAPGPDGLRTAIENIRDILDNATDKGERMLTSVEIYDIAMHIGEAVLSGGVRRSAILVMFDVFDKAMMNAKTGDYGEENPQRAMSNNSAVIIRDEAKKKDFDKIMTAVKTKGEPGFAIVSHRDIMYNPCFEVGMLPYYIDSRGKKHSGWAVCNLTEINGVWTNTPEKFYEASKYAALIGTLQAGYTDFKYLTKWSQKIIERDALIGVSITGVMNNPTVLLNKEVLQEGAKIVKAINKEISEIIGINPAKRTTVIKPAGNSSILLGTASGIHGEHAPRYIRNIKANRFEIGIGEIKKINPFAVKDSTTSTTDSVVSYAIKPKQISVFKRSLTGVNQLEAVKVVQENWILPGTVEEETYGIKINHNVSNTVTVEPEQWDEVRDYIWEFRDVFTGVSLISSYGELEYADAPFQTVKTPMELVEEYGDGALLASGLITSGLTVFKHLWTATDAARFDKIDKPRVKDDLMTKIDKEKKLDWIRKMKKFAKNYVNNDLDKAVRCLKEIAILHQYNKLKNESKQIDWTEVDFSTEAMQNAANIEAACAGGGCEIV